MRVNSLHNFLRSKSFRLFALAIISFCAIFFLTAFITGRSSDDKVYKRLNIAVRSIGHDLLLRAGDSTSVIPPVVQKSNGAFLLQFENEFKFQPDTLAAIAQHTLTKTGLSSFAVTVYKCDGPNIVYGFEINSPEKSIMSCLGRVQPKACYTIEVVFADFPDPNFLNSKAAIIISGILSLLVVGFVSTTFESKKTIPPTGNLSVQPEPSTRVTIGKFAFDVPRQCLILGGEIISLTDKECRILTSLHQKIGQLTLRDDLIQKIWTDEGVITGRSLDMFISKLRKKLSADPDVQITNIHGKGYRLSFDSKQDAGILLTP